MTNVSLKRRSPGRPRSEQAGEAIIGAAIELLLEDGGSLDSLSVGAVCIRAGVGKATLYRRWPTRNALITDLLSQVSDPPAPPSGKSIHQALTVALHDLHRWAEETVSGRLLPHLLGGKSSFPHLYEQYVRKYIDPRKAVIRRILEQGVQTRSLAPGIDIEAAVETLFGSVLFRRLLHGDFRADALRADERLERIVDLFMAGAGTLESAGSWH